MLLDPNPRADRPFDLLPFLQTCTHVARISRNRTFGEKVVYLFQRIIDKFLRSILRSKTVFATKVFKETESFTYVPPIACDSRLHVGYFQHWQYIERVWNVFGVELEEALSSISLPSNLNFINFHETCIVHIRRGDLVRSFETMGILDLKYYIEAISTINNIKSNKIKFIGITDDLIGARKVSEELGLEILLGPNDLSSWQSLALMARSGAVVCANSTFSWWGGILSAKNGGVVAIPDPWFVNWHQEVGESFLHPSLIPVKATFLESKDFNSDFEE